MKELIFSIAFILSSSVFASGSEPDKIREVLSKLSSSKRAEILNDCKKTLGSLANGKSESALIDLCIDKAKATVDPLDNYVDPDTLIDYEKEFASFSADKKKHVLNRCTMFVIQNEMGQSGEAAMSTQEIETYESRVLKRCEAVLNKHMWGVECTEDNQEECENKPTLDGKLYEVERSGNLLTYTLDQCVKRLKLTKASCEAPGGLSGATCTLDFRRQCYDFITTESTYLEDPNRELRTCAEFEDQTKTIALDCRSYCYQKKVCEVKDEDFLNRVIGNIYLRKKKGFSSCVKDKSFGVAGDNKIWVHQSCYGEFGIQYKDPDCGYRPTCEMKPFEGEHIPVQGREETFVTCDGNGSARPNDLDPRQNAPSNGKVWCKAHIFKKDKKGNLTDEIDTTKEVSRIYSVELLEKLGPHKCNPGGNGSAIDYLPKNKGSFDGGWGVEVINYCHARFKLNVAWKKKECTMAGQKSESGNTCCNGLVLDEETRVCNVPEFISQPVPEIGLLENFNANQQCNKQLDKGIISQAEKFFQELAVYENMFSQLDGKSDPINQISLTDKKTNEEVEFNRKLENKAIKEIHDAIIAFRHQYATVKLDYEELNNKIQCDMNDFMRIETAKMGKKVKDDQLPTPEKPCKWAAEVQKNIDEYIAYINVKNPSEDQKVELMAIPEDSFFKDADGIQIAAKLAQDFMIESNIAYTKGVLDALDNYLVLLDKAALTGQNIVWNCAHKENCSDYSWLIKHEKADTYGKGNLKQRDEFRVITDLLHSPLYPSKLLKSKAKILPELEPGYKKYLYNNDQYLQTEKEISEFSVYEPVIDYMNGSIENVKQPDVYKKVFQLYAHEFPLRSNSILGQDEAFSEFRYKLEDSTKYSKTNAGAGGIPQFCEVQNQTNYQVRVPFGKAVVPLRMVQINEFLYKYIEAQKELLEHQEECGFELDNSRATYTSNNYNINPTGTKMGSNTSSSNRKGKITLSNMISQLPSFDGKSVLGNNLLANKYLVNKSSSNQKGGVDGSQVGDVDSFGKAALYETNRKDRVGKQSLAIKQAKKKRNDSLIGKYVDSLKDSYGKAMNAASGNSLFNKLKNSFLNSGFGSGTSSSGSQDKKVTSIPSSGSYGSGGSGYSGGDGLRRQSTRGTDDYGSGSSSNAGKPGYDRYGNPIDNVTGLTEKETKSILEASQGKYDTYEGDTLFEKISNRYIKSAYPHLLKFRTKRKEID